MDEHVIAREAPWMVPVLVAAGVALLTVIVGLIIYIWSTFRNDIKERLDAQDSVLARLVAAVNDIKDLMQAEVGKIRDRLWDHQGKIGDHHSRLRRLEDHTGIGRPQRRYDDQETGD